MPPYLGDPAAWKALWPLPALAFAVGAILACFGGIRKGQTRSWYVYFVVLSSFSMLGAVTGTLAGFSATPTIGALLPSVLSLVGALTVYLVSRDDRDTAILVSLCVFCLALTLWVGTNWGSILRITHAEYEGSELALMRRAYIEKSVKEFRESLGLPPNIDRPAMSRDRN